MDFALKDMMPRVKHTERAYAEKDDISKDASCARELGMSYGKFMASGNRRREASVPPPATPDESELVSCKYCGAQFLPATKSQVFCCKSCCGAYHYRQQKGRVKA